MVVIASLSKGDLRERLSVRAEDFLYCNDFSGKAGMNSELLAALFARRAHFLSGNQLGGSLSNAGNGNRNACGR